MGTSFSPSYGTISPGSMTAAVDLARSMQGTADVDLRFRPSSACGGTFHPSLVAAPMAVAASPTYGIPSGAAFHPSPHAMQTTPSRILVESTRLGPSAAATEAAC